MTLKFLQEQLKQKSDEFDDLKESVEILNQAIDASYNASSKKSSNRLVDVNKSLCDEGGSLMYNIFK